MPWICSGTKKHCHWCLPNAAALRWSYNYVDYWMYHGSMVSWLRRSYRPDGNEVGKLNVGTIGQTAKYHLLFVLLHHQLQFLANAVCDLCHTFRQLLHAKAQYPATPRQVCWPNRIPLHTGDVALVLAIVCPTCR